MKKNRISVRFIASFMAFIVALVAMPLQAIAQEILVYIRYSNKENRILSTVPVS